MSETRRYRLTVRTRLALTYSALLTGAGVVMLALVYTFMRFVPTYDLSPTTPSITTPAETVPPVGTEPTEAAVISTPASELLISSADQMLNVLLITSIIVLIVLALVGIAVGWAVAGRMLRPLHRLNDAARKAARGDLRQRVRLEGPRDEISELSESFDDMLTQLDRSFAASKRFASNASHELLTPLATSRAMLDVAIAQSSTPEERAVFDRLRLMNERSIETADALLRLARIDASKANLETIDLARAVTQAVDACAEEAASPGVQIELDLEPASFSGDPVLVRQLLGNLLQNAIRYNNPEGGTIMIRTGAPQGHAVRLVIENSGQLLTPEKVAALTEPFVRGDGRVSASSSRGHGLGLSIVSAIVDRFHGVLDFRARPEGGLRVEITFAD